MEGVLTQTTLKCLCCGETQALDTVADYQFVRKSCGCAHRECLRCRNGKCPQHCECTPEKLIAKTQRCK